MDHLDVPQFFALLVVVLFAAKLFGALAKWIGQPAVLGELVAGVILGTSVLGFVNPQNEIVHLLAELGVVILLFEIGLETDLNKLVQVGGAAATVAIVGVALPFVLGYAVCWALGLDNLVSVVAASTLTATSVGITARVLSDLNRLHEPESQIILGAAVIDDVIGLVILGVVGGLVKGDDITVAGVATTTLIAIGFLFVTLLVGKLVVPSLFRAAITADVLGTATMLALMLALGLAWLASVLGSAVIIGAFAAGIVLHGTSHAREIEKGIAHLGHVFVPLFFVAVGAAVDIRVLNPVDPANRQTLFVAGMLIMVGVVGKFLAGYAPVWFHGNKKVIGVGMIPRGEVGLIFAQMGLASGVFSSGIFSAVTLMVMVTTFIAPPILKLLFQPIERKQQPPEPEGIEELVTEP